MTLRALVLLALAGCSGPGGASIAVDGSRVQSGLASCLATIGRADVAIDPGGPLDDGETEAFLTCVSDRANS